MTQIQENNCELPWDRLSSVTRSLYACDQIPLVGHTPNFPWQQLAQSLMTCFSLQGLLITPGELLWRDQQDLVHLGISSKNRLVIAATGIAGRMHLIISEQDILLLMSQIMHIDTGIAAASPQEFIKSFTQFLLAEILLQINNLSYGMTSFKIVDELEEDLAEEAYLSQNITVDLPPHRLQLTLLLSKTFQESWRDHSLQKYGARPTRERLESLPLVLHLEAGRTTLSLQDWEASKPGDVVLFDTTFFDPTQEKAQCLLTVNGKPLFLAKLDNQKLSILETPLHHEVGDTW